MTIKQLKHDGANWILHALNPSVHDEEGKGTVLGFLVGIVREIGSLKSTLYDPTGLKPDKS